MMVDMDACNELADSLYSEIKNHQELKKKDDILIKKQENDNKNLEESVKALTDLKESYKKDESFQKTKNKWIKGFATGFGVIAIVEAGYIALMTSFR